ncbi:MAG: CbiX/SirB N-terminal domain-containing protein [Aeromicrobium sp.]
MTISLVATSHGTDVAAARSAITALVDAVGAAAPHLDVREAFVDVQLPRVDTALDLVDGLAVVVPLLLAPGFHVRVDIGAAAQREWVVAAGTLGADDRLTAVMLRRLAQAGATRDDVVVLGSAGSTDPDALRSIDEAAGRLSAAWGSPVAVGHVGGSGTPMADVVRAVRRPGRRVVIVSYLMAPGFFYDRMQRCGADVVTGPLLDGGAVADELVSLVLDRFAEAAEHLDWSAVGSLTALPRTCNQIRHVS